ncbi:DUF4407 domain-containing protein [Actinomadura graeca]|uniref:DUF4407 domain-containing protein n=1 Tax=Actinomadura graeca TaxID=2750812 RepID=A0ABX8R2B0_9ACTN|nr:DUF4407 domain-containing protein [Actinomadura graeca]QXJ23832.1 DUF4407 domain-containing protein [Actinomadura graeca]
MVKTRSRWTGRLGHFLIFASGADRPMLSQCPEVERNRYQGLGGAVATTAITAAVSMAVAVRLAFHNTPAGVVAGVLWGLAVFNLDRWLVASYRSARGVRRKLITLAPRLLLSLVLGITISEPLVLMVFESEVTAQVTAIQRERQERAEQEIDRSPLAQKIRSYEARIEDLRMGRAASGELRAQLDRRAELQRELDQARRQRGQVGAQLQGEQNGSSGTGRVGDGPEARALRERLAGFDRQIADLERDLAAAQKAVAGQSGQANAEIGRLRADQAKLVAERDTRIGEARRANSRIDGLLVRIEALESLGRQHAAVRAAHYLLALLILLVDILPVMGKALMGAGGRSTYENLLAARELEAKEHSTRRVLRQVEATTELRADTHERRRHRRSMTRIALAEERYRRQRRVDLDIPEAEHDLDR